jgi:hypothetical protein
LNLADRISTFRSLFWRRSNEALKLTIALRIARPSGRAPL